MPGERYETPEVVAAYGAGLTPTSWGFHRSLRSRPGHPSTPRKVLLNTWEAVYFDHDLDTPAPPGRRGGCGRRRTVRARRRVVRIATRRPIADWAIGWSRPTRIQTASHRSSTMFVRWAWSSASGSSPRWSTPTATCTGHTPTGRWRPTATSRCSVGISWCSTSPCPARTQHVLDQLDALLRDHDIAYVKWDMNRDHVQGSGHDGAAGTHAQTLALYRLLDELRGRHPTVEIESCASGGGRIDHEILRRTQRVWTSDCNDALERQTIQRGLSMFVPPEVMGAHIGPPRSHTTGRAHTLAFRAATALFGHLGIEWNLLELDDRDRADLTLVVQLHQRFRTLLHSGDVVRFDPEYDGVDHQSQPVSSCARRVLGRSRRSLGGVRPAAHGHQPGSGPRSPAGAGWRSAISHRGARVAPTGQGARQAAAALGGRRHRADRAAARRARPADASRQSRVGCARAPAGHVIDARF